MFTPNSETKQEVQFQYLTGSKVSTIKKFSFFDFYPFMLIFSYHYPFIKVLNFISSCVYFALPFCTFTLYCNFLYSLPPLLN